MYEHINLMADVKCTYIPASVGYTIDPKTRYLSLGECVAPGDISHLYDSDVHPAPPPHSTPTAAAATKPALGQFARNTHLHTGIGLWF